MKLYFISGLGADSRVFKYIRLPEGFEAVFLEWIPPRKNESLHDYAMRLAAKIDLSEPFGLVGLSMGGMMATEIALAHPPKNLILLSSVPVSTHLPWYFRWSGRLGLHWLIPVKWVKSTAAFKRVFTVETKEDRKMLRAIIRDSDPHFIRWATNAILHWENDKLPASYLHLHGNIDAILPMRFTQPTHIIKGAGHLMVLTKAREINGILREILPNS
jgi:pimeloyl-ACP methyl ester carboxylesterase